MSHIPKREEILQGVTWKAEMPEKPHMYITLNHDEAGKLHEIFINYGHPEHYEMMRAIAVQTTRQLAAGVDPTVVVKDLKEIQSPSTNHFIPKGKGEAISLAARVGMIIEDHLRWVAAQEDLMQSLS